MNFKWFYVFVPFFSFRRQGKNNMEVDIDRDRVKSNMENTFNVRQSVFIVKDWK